MLFDPKNTFDRKRADAYYNKLMSGPDPFEITKKTKKKIVIAEFSFSHVGTSNSRPCRLYLS